MDNEQPIGAEAKSAGAALADDGGEEYEESEEVLEENLRAELERLRSHTAEALKKSWAEVEALQNQGVEGKDRVRVLERELGALRAQATATSPAAAAEQAAVPLAELNMRTGNATSALLLGRNDQLSRGSGKQEYEVWCDDKNNGDDESSYEEPVAGEPTSAEPFASKAAERRLSESSGSDSGVMFGRKLSDGVNESDSGVMFGRKLSHGALNEDDNCDARSRVSESAVDYVQGVEEYLVDRDDARSVGATPSPTERSNKREKKKKIRPKTRHSSNYESSQNSLADAMSVVSNMLNFDASGDEANMPEESRRKSAVEIGLMDQLASLDSEKEQMIDAMQEKVEEKEKEIVVMERTASEQAQIISQLEAELSKLQDQAEEEEKKPSTPDMSSVREEIERNRTLALTLERQVADAEYRLEARREKEQVLTSELKKVQASVKAVDEGAANQLKSLSERLKRANVSKAKYEEENRSMGQKTDDLTNKLRTELYDVLAEDARVSEAFINFTEEMKGVREKEEELSKTLVLRMQERAEVECVLETIKEIKKRISVGSAATQKVMQKYKSSLDSIDFDNNVVYGRLDRSDERTEALKKRNQDAIESLASIAEIQSNADSSIALVEGELLRRLEMLDWIKKEIDANGANTQPPPSNNDTTRDEGTGVIESAELEQREAKSRLDAIREHIKNNLLGNPILDGSTDSKAIPLMLEEGEEDEVFRLEEEISQKEERIADLQSTTARLSKQAQTLRDELSELEKAGAKDIAVSTDTLDSLQKQIEESMDVSAKRGERISKLQSTLSEKEAQKEALEKDLETMKGQSKRTTSDDDTASDDDMVDVPHELVHIDL